MKLKELKPILSADEVNLYLKPGTPLKFEMWDAKEYMIKGSIDGGDTMYKDYGEYEVEQIYEEDSKAINIDLVNK